MPDARCQMTINKYQGPHPSRRTPDARCEIADARCQMTYTIHQTPYAIRQTPDASHQTQAVGAMGVAVRVLPGAVAMAGHVGAPHSNWLSLQLPAELACLPPMGDSRPSGISWSGRSFGVVARNGKRTVCAADYRWLTVCSADDHRVADCSAADWAAPDYSAATRVSDSSISAADLPLSPGNVPAAFGVRPPALAGTQARNW